MRLFMQPSDNLIHLRDIDQETGTRTDEVSGKGQNLESSCDSSVMLITRSHMRSLQYIIPHSSLVYQVSRPPSTISSYRSCQSANHSFSFNESMTSNKLHSHAPLSSSRDALP